MPSIRLAFLDASHDDRGMSHPAILVNSTGTLMTAWGSAWPQTWAQSWPKSFSGAWDVLVLFLIPIGGGIPGGVLLAKTKGLHWAITALLYLISDIILALIFEPILLLVMNLGRRSLTMTRVMASFREAMKRNSAHYGTELGPLSLILISFGVDPMTGRGVAVSAGYGFVWGWTFAIAGDMIFFALLMASTLWLNGILGDGTWTTIIILALMFVIPPLVRRVRAKFIQ